MSTFYYNTGYASGTATADAYYYTTTSGTGDATGSYYIRTAPEQIKTRTIEREVLPPELERLDSDTYERLLEMARREKKIADYKSGKIRRKIQLDADKRNRTR